MTTKRKTTETTEQPKTNNMMLDLALKSGDMETVKKILFYDKFQKFQNECPQIVKTEKVITAHGEYYYAPLDEIRKQIHPLLNKYRLTYRWDFSETNGDIVCTCIITDSETGYEISSTMRSSKDATMENDVQAVGSATTYLQRYTLVSVLGLTSVDMDDDGRSSAPLKTKNTAEVSEIPLPKKKKIQLNDENLFGEENDKKS